MIRRVQRGDQMPTVDEIRAKYPAPPGTFTPVEYLSLAIHAAAIAEALHQCRIADDKMLSARYDAAAARRLANLVLVGIGDCHMCGHGPHFGKCRLTAARTGKPCACWAWKEFCP